jgi:hypothetical protein
MAPGHAQSGKANGIYSGFIRHIPIKLQGSMNK